MGVLKSSAECRLISWMMLLGKDKGTARIKLKKQQKTQKTKTSVQFT